VVESADELAKVIADAEVLALGQNSYDAKVADLVKTRAKKLGFVQLLTAGYDGPQVHGVPKGIPVSNAGDSWSPALAEIAFALLLALIKQIPEVLLNQKEHGWNRKFTAKMGGLDGKTLAVIGYGSIGREFARRAKAFGMHVIGVSRTAKSKEGADEAQPIGALHQVLGRADVVLLTAPLTPETKHLIDAKALAACKRDAVLINVARGGLIDQPALAAALKEGTIAGAGLDVTDPEPLPPDNPLWDAPNLIISPHIGGVSGKSGRVRLATFIGENIGRFAAGATVTHTVAL
jgi:phosphoglycerate dehydrogenase-like enzyme